MAFVRCLRLIFVQSLGDLLGSKKALFFAGGSLFYAFIVGFTMYEVGDRENPNELFCGVTLALFWQAHMPLTVMYFAISAVRDEIANRTLVFLLAGPVPRSAIWLGKFLAATAASAVILLAGYGVAAVAADRLAGGSWQPVTASTLASPWLPILLGAPAYAAIGTLFAVWFKRPMITGAVYVIGWEELVGSTPGQAGVRALTVVDSVRTLFYWRVPDAPHFQRSQRMWRGAGTDFAMPSAAGAMEHLLWLTAIVLLLALVAGAFKDYDSAPKE